MYAQICVQYVSCVAVLCLHLLRFVASTGYSRMRAFCTKCVRKHFIRISLNFIHGDGLRQIHKMIAFSSPPVHLLTLSRHHSVYERNMGV